jgi:NAD(P)H dehydrogenase (quinone)
MSLVLTGASGQLARRTAELLLERVDPSEIVLVTRSPEALSAFAERGVEVRRGDFDDPASLVEAFAGGERLLLISTDVIGTRVPQHLRAIDAAVAAGVRHVAYTGIGGPTEANPAIVAQEHRETEEALRASGLAWTFLRNSLYAEFEVPNARAAVATGQFITNRGDGRTAFVSREDCAAVAAVWLAGIPGSEGRAYDITGPELISPADEVELIAELTGSPVELVTIDDEAFAAGLAAATGMPIELAQTLATFGRAIREGHLSQLSTDVADLTGRPPRSLREVLEASLGEITPAA